MIESILNFIFSLNDLWRRSPDSLVTECRGYQKRIVVWSVVSVISMMQAIFVSPTPETVAIIYQLLYGMAILLFVT